MADFNAANVPCPNIVASNADAFNIGVVGIIGTRPR
jgi:hypothetical protein